MSVFVLRVLNEYCNFPVICSSFRMLSTVERQYIGIADAHTNTHERGDACLVAFVLSHHATCSGYRRRIKIAHRVMSHSNADNDKKELYQQQK